MRERERERERERRAVEAAATKSKLDAELMEGRVNYETKLLV